MGFAILVLLTFMSVGISYIGSWLAMKNIDEVAEVHIPTAITASDARTFLLRMLVAVQGYLALGEKNYHVNYDNANTLWRTAHQDRRQSIT